MTAAQRIRFFAWFRRREVLGMTSAAGSAANTTQRTRWTKPRQDYMGIESWCSIGVELIATASVEVAGSGFG